jgi:hypothetical protein
VAIIPPDDERTGQHWLLVRRSLTDGELAFYRCWSPTPVGLPTLVRVAGTRWCVETCFQTGKNATGLDEHQVRRWDSWYRNTTLVMLAHAILTVIAARERAHRPPADQKLIPLTVNEIRRLFGNSLPPPPTPSTTGWPGPAGADSTKPGPRPATTDAGDTQNIGPHLHNEPGLDY